MKPTPRPIPSLLLGALLCVTLVTPMPASSAEPLSADQVDQIYGYSIKIHDAMSVMEYRINNTFNRMDGEEIKDSQLTHMMAVPGPDDEHIVIMFDENGMPADTVSEDEKDGEKVGPMDAFKPENRENYIFTNDGFTEDGLLRVGIHPDEALERAFQGTLLVDTVAWAPHQVTGAPVPLPDKIQEMNITLTFAPNDLAYGIYTPVKSVAEGTAKAFLLLKIDFHVVQEFEDFKLVDELPATVMPKDTGKTQP